MLRELRTTDEAKSRQCSAWRRISVCFREVSMTLKDLSICLNSQNENSQMSEQPKSNANIFSHQIGEVMWIALNGQESFFGR